VGHSRGGRRRIAISLLLGILVVSGAYLARGTATASVDLEDANTFVAHKPLRIYQEVIDSDNDGIRDWVEELNGTDKLVSDRVKIASSTATTTPFIPDTETEKFAVAFFEDILKKNGGKDLTNEEKRSIIDTSVRRFASKNTNTLYTRNNITITEERSSEAVRTYGNNASLPLIQYGKNPTNVKSELVLLGSALEEDNPELLTDLKTIRQGYSGMIAALKNVSVPEPMINSHLALLNSLQAVHDDIEGFERAFTDPLIAFVRFKRYPNDVAALGESLRALRTVLESRNVVYAKDETGQFFFSLTP
jgi:hypothetical protein